MTKEEEVVETPVKVELSEPLKGSLSHDDLKFLHGTLDNLPDSEIGERIQQVLNSGRSKEFMYANIKDLAAVSACMKIVDKWRADIDHEGYVISGTKGNYESIDEISNDTLKLATHNVEVGSIMSVLSVRAEAAKLNMDIVRSQLRNELRKQKRTKRFGRKLTEKDIEDIARTHQRNISALKLWLEAVEISKMVASCYFAIQKVEAKLNDRIKTLLSQWGRDNCHGS